MAKRKKSRPALAIPSCQRCGKNKASGLWRLRDASAVEPVHLCAGCGFDVASDLIYSITQPVVDEEPHIVDAPSPVISTIAPSILEVLNAANELKIVAQTA
jgi:hypothetical protein